MSRFLDLCHWSRLANYYVLRGEWEMVCSRAAKADAQWFTIPTDALMIYARGEQFHCRACAAWEARQSPTNTVGGLTRRKPAG